MQIIRVLGGAIFFYHYLDEDYIHVRGRGRRSEVSLELMRDDVRFCVLFALLCVFSTMLSGGVLHFVIAGASKRIC